MDKRIGQKVKRIFSVLLSLSIIFSLLPQTAKAGDYLSHWAKESVERAVEMGWFLETEDDNYRPGDSITRAEFVTMINRMRGYKGTADLKAFSDVDDTEWYYAQFSAAVAAGYIVGSDGKLMPNEPITRQEAVTIFTRLAGYDETADFSEVLANVKDGDEIPDWARPFAGAAITSGLIAGSDEKFNGGMSITRGETAVLLERLHDDVRVFAFPGKYEWKTGENEVGSVVVLNRGVTLKNISVKENLKISESVGDGDVTLEGVKVGGKLDIFGAGPNSVYIKGGVYKEIFVWKDFVNVIISDLAAVTSVAIHGISDTVALVGGSIAQSVITAAEAARAAVEIGASSKVETLTIDAPEARTKLSSGSEVKTMNLSKTALASKIETESGGKIGTLTINAEGTVVTGKGLITTANIKAPSVVIEQKPVKTNIDSGLKANVGGTVITGGSGNGGGGGVQPTPTPTVVASAEVLNDRRIAVTMQNAQDAGFIITGNGYSGNASVLDYGTTKAGAFTLELSEPLTGNVTYTLTVSRPGYHSKSLSISWVQPELNKPSAAAPSFDGGGQTINIGKYEVESVVTGEGTELSPYVINVTGLDYLTAFDTAEESPRNGKWAGVLINTGVNITELNYKSVPLTSADQQDSLNAGGHAENGIAYWFDASKEEEGITPDEHEFTLSYTGADNSKIYIKVIYTSYMPPAPVPVNDLTLLNAAGADSAALSWTKTSGAATVEIYQKAIKNDETVYAGLAELTSAGYKKSTYSGTLTNVAGSAIVTGLMPGTDYTFVLIVTGGGNAGISNKLEVKTAEQPVNISTQEFSLNATENAFVLTVTDAEIKSDVNFNDFFFEGGALGTLTAADVHMSRVSATEMRFALTSGTWIAADDNIVTVMATGLENGAVTASAQVQAGNYYKISGSVLAGSKPGAAELSVAGQWVHLYLDSDINFETSLGSAQTDAGGGFTISGLHEGGGTYIVKIHSIPTAEPSAAIALSDHVSDAEITITLPEIDASEANLQFSETGVVTWDGVTNAARYDVVLLKGGILQNTFANADSGISVLSAMHGKGEGDYTVNLYAKADGYESAETDCATVRTIVKAEVTSCELNYVSKLLTWTGGGAVGYTVRIYQQTGTGTPTIYATYTAEHTDGDEGLDVSDKIGESTPAGIYTFTIQGMAARDSNRNYTSLFVDSDEIDVTSNDMPEIVGTVGVTVTKTGSTGTTIPAALNVSDSFNKNPGDSLEIKSTSGITITGGGDAFENSYEGFMLKEWSVTGKGTLSTSQGTGTVLTIDADAVGETPVMVEGEFEGTDVYVAPFYLKNSGTGYKIGDIITGDGSTGKVDIVPDADFDSNGIVYFVTKEQTFSFTDNSRGDIDLYTYTRRADTGSAAEMWSVTAEVSTYDGLTVAVNGAFTGDLMADIERVVKLGGDINGNAPFYFGDANTNDKHLTIDGAETYSLNFGLMFGTDSQNVTVKNMGINLTGNTSAAKAGDNTTAAVFLSGGENITLDNLTINTTGTPGGGNDGAGQPIYIGEAVTGGITVKDSVITAENGSGYQAAIYIANGAFDKTNISGNTLTASTPIAMNLAGVTLTASNADNIKDNDMTSTRGTPRSVRIDNLDTDFLQPTLTGSAVSEITLSDYFSSAEIDGLFEALCNGKEGFVINVSSETSNTASVLWQGDAWTLSLYQVSGTAVNTTAFVSGEYDKDDGVLTITTSGAVPVNVSIDLRMFVILGGVRLDTAGEDEAQNGYAAVMEANAGTLEEGGWHWSGNTLTIKLSANDKGRIDGIIEGIPTDSTLYAWADWNSAPGYNSAAATGEKICTVAT